MKVHKLNCAVLVLQPNNESDYNEQVRKVHILLKSK
jgi:hypothetical protein